MNARTPAPLNTGALVGIVELHDLSFGHQAAPLLRLLSQEADLFSDLLRPRPWLARQEGQAVLEALLEQEWTGFVARLGRSGPWVYASTVQGLQRLSAGYTRLTLQARGHDLTGCDRASLLGRLWADGHWKGSFLAVGARPVKREQVGQNVNVAANPQQAELDFWTLAQTLAAQQRRDWAAR